MKRFVSLSVCFFWVLLLCVGIYHLTLDVSLGWGDLQLVGSEGLDIELSKGQLLLVIYPYTPGVYKAGVLDSGGLRCSALGPTLEDTMIALKRKYDQGC